MNQIIKYENWPVTVKIVTAFFNKIKKFSVGYNVSLGIGYVLLGMGLISLVYAFLVQSSKGYTYFIEPIAFLFVGVANVVSGFSHKWVAMNSSWDERKRHKSSMIHKILYILITVLILACVVATFIY